MVRKMLENMKVPNNPKIDDCKCIFSNTHGQIFFNAVAYLSVQVTQIFPNAKIENKKKRQLSDVRTGQGGGRGHGHGL